MIVMKVNTNKVEASYIPHVGVKTVIFSCAVVEVGLCLFDP